MENKDFLNLFAEIINKGTEKENELLNNIKDDVKFVKIKFIYGEKNEVHESIITNTEIIKKLINFVVEDNRETKNKFTNEIENMSSILDK